MNLKTTQHSLSFYHFVLCFCPCHLLHHQSRPTHHHPVLSGCSYGSPSVYTVYTRGSPPVCLTSALIVHPMLLPPLEGNIHYHFAKSIGICPYAFFSWIPNQSITSSSPLWSLCALKSAPITTPLFQGYSASLHLTHSRISPTLLTHIIPVGHKQQH